MVTIQSKVTWNNMNPQKGHELELIWFDWFFRIQVMAFLHLEKIFKDILNMDILIGCIALVCIIPDYIVVSYLAV